VIFTDGLRRIINLEAMVRRPGPVFAPLQDPTFFEREMFVGTSTIEWTSGASVAPETLYELGEQVEPPHKRPPAPPMQPAALRQWREEHGLSETQLAEYLGVDRTAVWKWEKGNRRIPPYLDRALRDLHRELTAIIDGRVQGSRE
jgi:DNA-binding transcriptional regulator YiaG